MFKFVGNKVSPAAIATPIAMYIPKSSYINNIIDFTMIYSYLKWPTYCASIYNTLNVLIKIFSQQKLLKLFID